LDGFELRARRLMAAYVASPIRGLMNFEKYSKNNLNRWASTLLLPESSLMNCKTMLTKKSRGCVTRFLDIVERLNALGHHLEMYDETRVGTSLTATNPLTDNAIFDSPTIRSLARVTRIR